MSKMTQEQRTEAARAKRRKFKDANAPENNTGRIDWKKGGKVLIYLHPDADIHKRRQHFLRIEGEVEEVKNGRKVKRKVLLTRSFNCPGEDICPACQFRARVREDSSIDNDDVVLEFRAGRDVEQWTKGDVIKAEGYDFRKDLYARPDFVTIAVVAEDSAGNEPEEPKAEIFQGSKSLGRRIDEEIDSEIDERGEDIGNPWINPYPFRLTFDDSKPPSDKYGAHAIIDRKPTEKVQAALDGPVPDLSREISTDGMVDAIRDVIEWADVTGQKVETSEPEPETPRQRAVKRKAKAKVKPDPEPEPEPELEAGSTFECPECGYELPSTVNECPECGTEFEDEAAPF